MSNIQIPADKSSAIMITDKHGVTRYLNEFGQLHRDGDLPALIHPNHKTLMYYQNGLLHRDNGPAKINSHQEVYYYKGSIHRDDNLPAKIDMYIEKDGSKTLVCEEYYRHGAHHRDNGPAVLWSSGSYQFYKKGELHNENGPACHWVNSEGVSDEYYLNGKNMSKTGFKIATLRNNLFSQNSTKHQI